MTDIPRYNAPRGTTLCEAAGGELVMAADHDLQVSALRAALHSCAKASPAAEVGLIVNDVMAAVRVTEVRQPGPGEITVERDLAGNMHIKIGDFDAVQVHYRYPYTDNAGTWRLAERIADMLRNSATEQPAQVNRIPAGLYAELEALRTLRDATGVYLQGYMLDEIEDEDNCVTEDQHDAACTVKLALDKAMALEWKGGGEDHSHG